MFIGFVFSLYANKSNLLKTERKAGGDDIVFLSNDNEDDPQAINGPGGYNQSYLRTDLYFNEEYFTMNGYFNHLSEYQPLNEYGSCAYVSLISVMSYYDSFFNDCIIPERYDFYDDTLETYQQAYAISPGTKSESCIQQQFQSYYYFCHSTMLDNLQSRLTVIKNQFYGTDTPNAFVASTGMYSYQNVLNNFYSFEQSNISVSFTTYSNKTQAQYEQIIKSLINQEKPVIVEIRNSSTGSGHSVVAYDFDENNIYANYGWGPIHTHNTLFYSDFDAISGVCAIDFSANKHIHSNNYFYGGKGHCGCGLSDEIKIVNGTLKQNVPPTIYWMRNFFDINEKYEVYLRVDYDDYNFIYYTNISENKITLSESQWEYFLEFYEGQGAFYLRRISSLANYEVCETTFSWGIYNAQTFTQSPNSYGFPDAYCWSEIQTLHSIYDVSFTTKRLRCGYIHNEFVNLSPRRNNAGVAYLEFVFNVPIYKIEVNISFWGSNENTSSNNATGYIQYLGPDGYFINVIDLYNDINLSRDRTNQDHLYLTFPEETSVFRFYTTAQAIGNSNLGRISIGELTVFGDGFEIDY